MEPVTIRGRLGRIWARDPTLIARWQTSTFPRALAPDPRLMIKATSWPCNLCPKTICSNSMTTEASTASVPTRSSAHNLPISVSSLGSSLSTWLCRQRAKQPPYNMINRLSWRGTWKRRNSSANVALAGALAVSIVYAPAASSARYRIPVSDATSSTVHIRLRILAERLRSMPGKTKLWARPWVIDRSQLIWAVCSKQRCKLSWKSKKLKWS